MKKQLYIILFISIFLFIEKVNGHKFDKKDKSNDINDYRGKKDCPRRHFHDYKNKKNFKDFKEIYLRRYNKTDKCNDRWRRHKNDENRHHPYERRDHYNKYDKDKKDYYEKKWGKKGKNWKKGRRHYKGKIICKIFLFILLLSIILGIRKLYKKCKYKKLSPILMKYLKSPYPKNIPFTPVNPTIKNNNNLNAPMIELNNAQNNNNNLDNSYINPYMPDRKL